MKNLVRILFPLALVIYVNAVYAQMPVTTSSDQVQIIRPQEVSSIIVADVSLTDVTFKRESDNKITGSFSLVSEMGKQNDIVYGMHVIDGMGNIVDASSLGKVATIREGEIVRRNFSYSIPPYISGDNLSFDLVAETTGGLPLGSQKLLQNVSIPGVASLLTCTNKNRQEISCVSTIDTTLVIGYHVASPLGKNIVNKELPVRKNTPTPLPVTSIPPGRYYVDVFTKDGNGHALASFVVQGSYGNILNTSISELSEGKILVITTVNASPSKGIQVKNTITDDSGRMCTSDQVDASTFFARQEFLTDCRKGAVITTLLSSSGVVLSSSTNPFDIQRYVQQSTTSPLITEKNTTSLRPSPYQQIAIGLFVGIIAVTFFSFMRRVRVKESL